MIPLKPNDESRRTSLWMDAARAHDPRLYVHCLLVSQLCASFSAFLNQTISDQRTLARAGLLYDIGKIKIPIAILAKPSSLSTEELLLVQSHTQFGYEMLLEAGETNETLLSVTRDHHERLDGSGYPRKLTAEQISIPVRMVTLCDIFAAITEPRPYAEVMCWDQALNRMAEKRTRLDLDLLSAFATMVTAMNVPKKRLRLFQVPKRRQS